MNIQNSFRLEESRTFGTLYLVATPIGHLDDMTIRAVQTLQAVDAIAAEDTRHTQKLLQHYQVKKPLIAHHKHNEQASTAVVLEQLLAGRHIALVSDAGMPLVSDPGSVLVREALRRDIAVVPIPGVCAAVTAWVASGIEAHAWTFHGFLPREQAKAETYLRQHQHDSVGAIFYEAPHRLERTLERIASVWGDRQAVLARELTKRYEQFVRGTIYECVAWCQQQLPRGEFCIVVAGFTAQNDREEWGMLDVVAHVAQYEARGFSHKEALRRVAEDRGCSRRDVYQMIHAPTDSSPVRCEID